MEVWRDELYHALRLGSFNLPKIGIKPIGGKTTGNGEWKQHKYIRKEGNKYIYPEDLQKKSNSSGGKTLGNPISGIKSRVKNITGTSGDISRRGQGLGTGPVGSSSGYSGRPANSNSQPEKPSTHATLNDLHKNNITNKFGPNSTISTITTSKTENKSHRKVLVGGGKVMREAQKVVDKTAGKKDSAFASERIGQNTYTTQLHYRNGQQWFDTVDIYSQSVPSDGHGNNNDTYIYSYGYFHQAYNSGKSFLNKLFGKKKG